MTGAMGFWDALFGEKVQIELPDGSKRRVTRKWLDEMVRQGRARQVNPTKVIADLAESARTRADSLVRSPSQHAESLASQILLISMHEVSVLAEVWGRELDDETQCLLFAEYSAFLVSCVGRLALAKFGEPTRSGFMNTVVDRVKRGFCGQPHFGNDEVERGEFYEALIAARLQGYSSAQDMGSQIFAAAKLLVETFCDHVPESRWPGIAIETGKSLSTVTTSALAVSPPFRALLPG